MGRSAWRLALDLQDIVRAAEPQRNGLSDADLAAKTLATRKELQKDWAADTCRRYLAVAAKLDSKCQQVLDKWELTFQRQTLVDTITVLRAAATACQTPDEMLMLLQTLFWEQTCKLRRSIAPKGRGHATDVVNIFRGILLRGVFLGYLRQIFPCLTDAIAEHGTWKFYNLRYGMTEGGLVSKEHAADSDDEPETPAKGVCPEQEVEGESRFSSKTKLVRLCEHVSKGAHDWAFAQAAKTLGSASNLDLSLPPMKTLHGKVQEIWGDYMMEFPANPVQAVAADIPCATVAASSGGATTRTVKASSAIQSEEEYQGRLSSWMQACQEAMEESVRSYISSTVVLAIAPYETCHVEKKLAKIPFMSEPGRKMFVYDSFCRDPMDWTSLKKGKRGLISGAKVQMTFTHAGEESGDTLTVLKEIYTRFRTERADHLSEDMLVCLVPGSKADTPVNDMLQAAWRSLKAMGSKFHGPKIGQLRVSQEALLAHIYTRGAWNRTPGHHLVFTYQASPQECSGRKKMRYLKDHEKMGDTYFNDWPVPMYQLSQQSKLTMAEHDCIFAEDHPVDSGDEDGAGASQLQDLGEKVVPFPREWHVKLWQEMIHVWGIDVAVMFHPGGGQSLLAFVLERKRAVGIVKNKAHKDYVQANLVEAVKALGLAPDRRPVKPSELTTWEASRVGAKAAHASGAPLPRTANASGANAPASAPMLGTLIPSAGERPFSPPMPAAAATPLAPAGAPSPTTSQTALAAFGSAALR